MSMQWLKIIEFLRAMKVNKLRLGATGICMCTYFINKTQNVTEHTTSGNVTLVKNAYTLHDSKFLSW
jgi:hypothetical protein